jgi:hypothetical protein
VFEQNRWKNLIRKNLIRISRAASLADLFVNLKIKFDAARHASCHADATWLMGYHPSLSISRCFVGCW